MRYLQKGKLNVGPIDSGSFGSGGKGKVADYLASTDDLDFAVSQNSVQASHITVFDDGTTYKFQHLPSSVSNPNVKVVLGADMSIDLPVLLKEIRDWSLDTANPQRLFVHPNAVVISEKNRKWEEENLGCIGSTMTGVAAAKSMKMLRLKDEVITTDMVPELAPYIANTNELIAKWLKEGQTGLLETAQGYDLSLDNIYSDDSGAVHKFFPFTTSRNINPMSFVGSTFAPHKFVGKVFMNLRTFPIRVGDASTMGGGKVIKFEDGSEVVASDGELYYLNHHTSISSHCVYLREIVKLLEVNEPVVFENGKKVRGVLNIGSSGGMYPDQVELDWAKVSEQAGIPVEEKTSLTKRVRRVFSPSNIQLKSATMVCQPDMYSINFVNYLDKNIAGMSGSITRDKLKEDFPAVYEFVRNVEEKQYWAGTEHAGKVVLLGTGPRRSEMLELVDADDGRGLKKYLFVGAEIDAAIAGDSEDD